MNDDLISISTQIRRLMNAERRRTGVSPAKALKARADVPATLSGVAVNRWMTGLTTTAPKRHVDYMLTLWAEMPDDAGRLTTNGLPRIWTRKNEEHFVPLTSDMVAELHAQLARTGLMPRELMQSRSDAPDGFRYQVIGDWFHHRRKTVSQPLWDWVMNALRAHPDKGMTPKATPKSDTPKNAVAGRPTYRAITDGERAMLIAHRDRTGLNPNELFKLTPSKPATLHANMVKAWMLNQTRSADPELMQYVLDLYASLPSKLLQ